MPINPTQDELARARNRVNWNDPNDPLMARLRAYCDASGNERSAVLHEAIRRHHDITGIKHPRDHGERIEDFHAHALALFLVQERA